jgi:hypothetical protein
MLGNMLFAQECQLMAHSHNDYEHERPLYEALACGFKSIEADIFSIGDSLYVAHDFDKIVQGRTLRNLYLEPLKKEIEKNNGSVYGDGQEILLFIDIKDDSIRTYQLLHQVLREYESCLSVFVNGEKTVGPIMPVVSGNRPLQYMRNQDVRYAGYDGRLSNLDGSLPPSLMPVISDNWNNYFQWDGTGEIPTAEKRSLHELVARVNAKGYLLRFWATPNQTKEHRKAVWTELKNAGVSIIGTDHLYEMKDFMEAVNYPY